MLFIETNRPVQGFGCVESDGPASRFAEFIFRVFKETGAQTRSVQFGSNCHTSKVSFAALQNLVSDGPKDFLRGARGHNHRHF